MARIAAEEVSLQQLRALAAVAETGSFTLAAESLQLTQPAISHLVKRMEEDLGQPLVVRGRRIRMTDAGQMMVDTAVRALRLIDESVNACRSQAQLREGRVVLAVGHLTAGALMPPLLGRFAHKHPKLATTLLANTGKAAAVFHVYDRLHLDRLPRRFMVEPGKQLDDAWNAMSDDSGAYDLWVLGPNGYHRHFKGDLNRLRAGGAAIPEVRVCYDIANGNVYLEMLNAGQAAAKFTVRAKAYRDDGPWSASVAGGAKAELHWDLAASGAWYDFVVSCDADASWQRRFAGRVETGKHGVSDPALGMADL